MLDALAAIVRHAQPYWQTRKNELHVPLVYAYSQRLLAHYPQADAAVVLPAALLHDNGWFMVPESRQQQAFGPNASDKEANRLHELEGVRIAGEILGELAYDAARSEQILAIIEGHDSRLTALSLDDSLVKDADKLWRFDPIGFAVDQERFGMDFAPYYGFLDERLDSWLFTPAAKEIARHHLDHIRRTAEEDSA